MKTSFYTVICYLLPLTIVAEVIVYDNRADPINAIFAPFSDFSELQQNADDFILGTDQQINGVMWTGAYFNDDLLADDTFTIRFFNDDGTNMSPAVVPLAEFSLDSVNRFDTGIDVFGSDVYQYETTFQEPFEADAGILYWISIMNDTPSDSDAWAWVDGGLGNSAFRSFDSVLWNSDPGNTNELDFKLVATIPEPGSISLFLSMLGCFLVFVCRRQKMFEGHSHPMG